MKQTIILIAGLIVSATAFCQDSVKTYKKGSYLSYGQPNIEDNSMFIEEAFNQERAVIQHISNFIFDKTGFQYVFTQEIPLPSDKHQLSVGLVYNSLKESPTGAPSPSGFGDMYLNYRPMLMDKTDWALVIPRFTVIAPTGNPKYGFGSGGWGAQFNLAATKRLNNKINANLNAGFTSIFKEDFFADNGVGDVVLTAEENHTSFNFGASAIYLLSDRFNFLCEYVAGSNKGFDDIGETIKTHNAIINPGFRFAFNLGVTQVVPGIGVPFNFHDGEFVSAGAFVYLSIEPNYAAK
jgi:hypothetical protein